jgi:hypothetical protein
MKSGSLWFIPHEKFKVNQMKFLICMVALLSACASPPKPTGGDNCVQTELRPAGTVTVERCVEWRFNPSRRQLSIFLSGKE